MLYTREFWKDTIERVVYTACETAVGVIGGTMMITGVHWGVVGSTTALAAVVTLLKCIMVATKKE